MFTDTDFDVVPVNHQSPGPPSEDWPSNENEWYELRDNLYARHQLSDALSSESRVIQSLATAKPKTVHCKCALISYLHRNEIPTFSYIGVSKLCCKPCYAWILAYNEHAESGRYDIKGCHDKWYLGWKRPLLDTVAQERVDEGLVRLVVREYCQTQLVMGKARPRSISDSSTSSEPADIETCSDGEYEDFKDMLRNVAKKEREGNM